MGTDAAPAHNDVAYCCDHAGTYDKSLAHYEESLKLARKWQLPLSAYVLNFAWFLATCRHDRLRGGSRAVTLSRQAFQATSWNHAFCLGTLAVACADTGSFAEAIRWQ